MDATERDETTRYVIRTIDSCLQRGDHNIALLLASIYAGIRLRTLIVENKSPDKGKWKQTHEKLGRKSFQKLLEKCESDKILKKNDVKKLDKIRLQRNSIVHESKLWREPTSKDIDDIKRNCEFLKDFFQRTT